MNLDDRSTMQALDTENMLSHIDRLDTQFADAWDLSQRLPLPESHQHPRLIVLCGMGGSAIGGDLAAALVAGSSPIPFMVVRGYDLPAFVSGEDALVIASSHSGNTEETLSAVEQAVERGARVLAITTGGALAEHAARHQYPLWQFSYESQPRAALGWSFGLLIGLAHRLKLAEGLDAALQEGVALLRRYADIYGAESGLAANPAKRGAGQLMGRIPVFFGSGPFEAVARRWKCQLNENSNAWSQWEDMPEANHNFVAGIDHPDDLLLKMAGVFITSQRYDHPRVRLRHELTFKLCLQNAIMADTFQPEGESLLAQMMHAIQYGDYLSYYLAIAYGADPTAIPSILAFKAQLADRS